MANGLSTDLRQQFIYGVLDCHVINRNLKHCRFKIKCFPRALHKAILLNEIHIV